MIILLLVVLVLSVLIAVLVLSIAKDKNKGRDAERKREREQELRIRNSAKGITVEKQITLSLDKVKVDSILDFMRKADKLISYARKTNNYVGLKNSMTMDAINILRAQTQSGIFVGIESYKNLDLQLVEKLPNHAIIKATTTYKTRKVRGNLTISGIDNCVYYKIVNMSNGLRIGGII